MIKYTYIGLRYYFRPTAFAITGVILIYNLRADIFAVIPLPIDASTLLVVHTYAVAAFPCDRHSLSAYVIYTPIIDRYENSIRCCLC